MKKLLLLLMAVSLQTVAHDPADIEFNEMLKRSLRTEGVAAIQRIEQDLTQAFCSHPEVITTPEGMKRATEIQQLNQATILPPSDGVFIGDWRRGEIIAQSGRGGTWADSSKPSSGGGCYNCHQIDRKEIAYGNLGPSLWNYGKQRGYSLEVIHTTWNKIFNAKAYHACSSMPRFGYLHLLTEEQIKDVMGLLLDPNSPVNE